MASGTLNNGQNGSPWANKNRQSTYGQGLGGIQAWGYANPLGPYAGLQNNTPGAGGSGSGSSTAAPVASGADKWLEDVLAGKNLPFSPEQQAAQLTQQSDMSAAAEGARNEQAGAAASAGGSSGRDPSLQGAKMNSLARRQTDNQQAAGNIAAQAGQVNFGAQMNAANTLSGNSMTREGWNQQNRQSASNNAQQFLPWNQSGGGNGGNNFKGGMASLTPNRGDGQSPPYRPVNRR